MSLHFKSTILLKRGDFLVMLIAPVCAAITLALNAAEKPDAPPAVKGETYYAKINFFTEENKHFTTNYRKGIMIPINSEVTFLKNSGGDTFYIKTADGRRIEVENVENYSGETRAGAFARMFGKEKVDLGKFTEAERKAIETAEITPGLSKAAVICAIGYPPKHRTPTLKGDQWRYWRDRFVNYSINFENDKVVNIGR